MSSRARRIGGVGALIAAVLLPLSVRAQQPPATDAGGQQFQRGRLHYLHKRRRDPFTFRKYQPPSTIETPVATPLAAWPPPPRLPRAVPELAQPEVTETPKVPDPAARITPARTDGKSLLQRLVQRLENIHMIAQQSLALTNYGKALEACDEALTIIDSERADVPPEVEENLLRVRKAARRLQNRRSAEGEFHQMSITIQGIVWRKSAPTVILNGQILNEGDTVDGKTQIHRIEPHYVIFLYKGYKIRKWLGT